MKGFAACRTLAHSSFDPSARRADVDHFRTARRAEPERGTEPAHLVPPGTIQQRPAARPPRPGSRDAHATFDQRSPGRPDMVTVMDTSGAIGPIRFAPLGT